MKSFARYCCVCCCIGSLVSVIRNNTEYYFALRLWTTKFMRTLQIELDLTLRLKCSSRNRRDFIVFLYYHLLIHTECLPTSEQNKVKKKADECYEVTKFLHTLVKATLLVTVAVVMMVFMCCYCVAVFACKSFM